MTPEAMEACACTIEDLTVERDRWKDAYVRLANNRMQWVWATLRNKVFPVGMSSQVIARRMSQLLADRLRRVW